MSDLVARINEAFDGMNDQERRAYSAGMSHVYGDVFEVFSQAFGNNLDLHEAFTRISGRWDYVRDMQIVKGVL